MSPTTPLTISGDRVDDGSGRSRLFGPDIRERPLIEPVLRDSVIEPVIRHDLIDSPRIPSVMDPSGPLTVTEPRKRNVYQIRNAFCDVGIRDISVKDDGKLCSATKGPNDIIVASPFKYNPKTNTWCASATLNGTALKDRQVCLNL